MEDIYVHLKKRLDDMGTGFPGTKSGIELRILKRLFSEADAKMFLMMTPMLESPEKVAKRLNLPQKDVAAHLEDMAKKGLLFRKSGDPPRYAAIPFVVGIFEFQLNRMDETLARDMEQYYEEALGKSFAAWGTPLLRTIPVSADISLQTPVAPYEDVFRIIDEQKRIAIAPCICRTTAAKAGKGCDKPLEACFLFGSHADYYVENKMGRYIEKEEAKRILVENERAGLVMQPFNARNPGGMCSCCGCCCGILRSVKMQENPAQAVRSNYYASVDMQECAGCGTCVDRCHMEAAFIDNDGLARIDPARCIGCGLCVTTCPTGAMRLERKEENELYVPPENGIKTYINIARARGKI